MNRLVGVVCTFFGKIFVNCKIKIIEFAMMTFLTMGLGLMNGKNKFRTDSVLHS